MRNHLALLLIGVAGCTSAAASNPAPAPVQDPAGRQTPAASDADSGRGGGGAGQVRPRAYNRVITSDARTRRGLFNVHRVNDRLYFEIPRRELGKDQIAIGRYTRAAAPSGQQG